uniref:Ribosomal protein S1 n=1 Tax=Kumanoa americana TaxID=1196377 RepID=A0A1C9CGT2_9FLOR|nr:ribosomal protein S1 [Kumanoa americana]AOM67579.1 ribosomal protein S1 [Kumanoa americana]
MSFTHKNFARILTKYNYDIKEGDIIAGTIFSKEKKGYLVDIGNPTVAFLPLEEVSFSFSKIKNIETNLTQEFFIFAYSIHTKTIIVSIKRLVYIRSWERIKQLYKENTIIYTRIIGQNKGGLLIELENIQGFIPKSHLCYMINRNNVTNLDIPCKFLIANEQSNQLVLSNRAAILEYYISNLKIGTIFNSTIIAIKPYGIFVNIYNIPALLHISEAAIPNINDLTNQFFLGQTINVKIIHVDTKQGRLSVSRRNIKA